MSCEELNEYRLFLERISVNQNQNSLNDEVLLTKTMAYQLNGVEVIGEFISCSLHYLTEIQCPPKLIPAIVKNITKDFQAKTEECPMLDESDSNLKTYNSLNLKLLAIKSIRTFCHRLLDNIELNKILSSINESTHFEETPINVSGAMRNRRRFMEDRHICVDDFKESYNIENCERACFYAVFDGHDGINASTYASAQLPYFLAIKKYLSTKPEESLRQSFLETDLRFVEKSVKGGSTAVCALYFPETLRLYVAWVGDSKALLVKQGKIMQIVKPHSPEDPKEKKRICDAGGSVMKWEGSWRVDGLINLSRAIGDARCKPYLTAEPDIVGIELDKHEDFLVLACDGLWDHVEEGQVASIIYESVRQDCENLKRIPELLIDKARTSGSTDNITVVVVFLKRPCLISKNSNPIEIMDSAFCDSTENVCNSEQELDIKLDIQTDLNKEQVKDIRKENLEQELLQQDLPILDSTSGLQSVEQFNNGLNNGSQASIQILNTLNYKNPNNENDSNDKEELYNENEKFEKINESNVSNDDENIFGPETCVDFSNNEVDVITENSETSPLLSSITSTSNEMPIENISGILDTKIDECFKEIQSEKVGENLQNPTICPYSEPIINYEQISDNLINMLNSDEHLNLKVEKLKNIIFEEKLPEHLDEHIDLEHKNENIVKDDLNDNAISDEKDLHLKEILENKIEVLFEDNPENIDCMIENASDKEIIQNKDDINCRKDERNIFDDNNKILSNINNLPIEPTQNNEVEKISYESDLEYDKNELQQRIENKNNLEVTYSSSNLDENCDEQHIEIIKTLEMNIVCNNDEDIKEKFNDSTDLHNVKNISSSCEISDENFISGLQSQQEAMASFKNKELDHQLYHMTHEKDRSAISDAVIEPQLLETSKIEPNFKPECSKTVESCSNEKCDESDDEWNYMRMKEGEGEKQETENSEKGIINSSGDTVLNEQKKIDTAGNGENKETNNIFNQKNLDIINFDKIAETDDMNYQLNPDAKEFVPTSPPDFAKLTNGYPKFQQRFEDDVVAQSPRKASVNMEDIQVPEEEMFDKEAAERPHEVAEELIISEEAPIACGILCGDENTHVLKEGFKPIADHIHEKENNLVVEQKINSNTLGDFTSLSEFDNMDMNRSVYIENLISNDGRDESDLLNHIQPIPDEIKDNSLTDEVKESVKQSEKNSSEVIDNEQSEKPSINAEFIPKDITNINNIVVDIDNLNINTQENGKLVEENFVDLKETHLTNQAKTVESNELAEITKKLNDDIALISATADDVKTSKSKVLKTVTSPKVPDTKKTFSKTNVSISDSKKSLPGVKDAIKKKMPTTKPKTMVIATAQPPKTVTISRPRSALTNSSSIGEKKIGSNFSVTNTKPQSAGLIKRISTSTSTTSTTTNKVSLENKTSRPPSTTKSTLSKNGIEAKASTIKGVASAVKSKVIKAPAIGIPSTTAQPKTVFVSKIASNVNKTNNTKLTSPRSIVSVSAKVEANKCPEKPVKTSSKLVTNVPKIIGASKKPKSPTSSAKPLEGTLQKPVSATTAIRKSTLSSAKNIGKQMNTSASVLSAKKTTSPTKANQTKNEAIKSTVKAIDEKEKNETNILNAESNIIPFEEKKTQLNGGNCISPNLNTHVA